MPYVTRPVLVFPPHEVTLEEIRADIERRHPDHPRLAAVKRVVGGVGVSRRYFAHPLAQVSGPLPGEGEPEPLHVRNARAFEDLRVLAEQATVQLLDEHGLRPEDIDGLIVAHSTGLSVPGLDVHLMNTLRFKPSVIRLPMTQLGCAGGAYGLMRAAELVRVYPHAKFLVVAAETLSSLYLHSDKSIESMIYKGLFGDSGAAAIVSGEPLGDGLQIQDGWEYVLPDTTARYRMRIEVDALHFASTKEALLSTSELVPPLLDWYGADNPLDYLIAHTGGRRILEDLEAGVGCDPKLLAPSWNSLDERGNLGGPSVLDVLARHHDDPPQHGAQGLLLGLGPGFAAAALRTVWHNQ